MAMAGKIKGSGYLQIPYLQINHQIVDLLPFSIGTPLSANNFLFADTLSASNLFH